MSVNALVESRRVQIEEICRHYGVKRLDLFGSAAKDQEEYEGFDPDRSDVDFVVSFERRDPPELFDRYFGLKEDLEALFGRGVDLVMEGAVGKNAHFARSVEESRVPVYAS